MRTSQRGAVGGHATPIYPTEAGGGHCPAVHGTRSSPQHRSPATGCQDIPDVQVQPWPLRLPQEQAGSRWARIRSRTSAGPGAALPDGGTCLLQEAPARFLRTHGTHVHTRSPRLPSQVQGRRGAQWRAEGAVSSPGRPETDPALFTVSSGPPPLGLASLRELSSPARGCQGAWL